LRKGSVQRWQDNREKSGDFDEFRRTWKKTENEKPELRFQETPGESMRMGSTVAAEDAHKRKMWGEA
jgi:hypothetical protein